MVERMEERGSNWFPENDGKRDLVMVKSNGNNNIYGYKKIGWQFFWLLMQRMLR